MENKENKNKKKLTPEEEEKKAIEWEHNVLKYALPITGAAGFIIGLLGFILTVATNAPIAIFFMIITLLSAGGVAYGILLLVKKITGKYRKEIKQPDGEVVQ